MASGKKLLERFDTAKRLRANWEGLWDDVAELVMPGALGATHQPVRGGERRSKLFDTTGERANQALAAQLAGELINPALQWVTLRVRDDALMRQEDVVEWLLAVQKTIKDLLNDPHSQFHTRMHEVFLNLGAFGTGILFIGEGDSAVPIEFRSLPLHSTYVMENAGGRIDTLFHLQRFNLRQFKQEFGREPEERLAREWRGDPEERKEFVQIVLPREDVNPELKDAVSMPFGSFHVAVATGDIVKESGFRGFPFMVPRWLVRSGEVYGVGPGVTTLPDNRMLQRIVEVTLRGAQKAIDPPLQAPDDGYIGPVRTIPGGINFYRAGSRDRIEPIPIGASPQFGEALSQQVRDALAQGFFIDLALLDVPEPRVAAAAILDRRDERFRRMVPMITRAQTELLAPAIERILALLGQMGLLPPAPQVPEGADDRIEAIFVSPAVLAQRVTEADNITRFLQRAFPIFELKPEAADVLDGDATVRELQRLLSASPAILADEETVEETRTARAEAQEVQQGLEQLQQGVDIAGGVASLAAEGDTGTP